MRKDTRDRRRAGAFCVSSGTSRPVRAWPSLPRSRLPSQSAVSSAQRTQGHPLPTGQEGRPSSPPSSWLKSPGQGPPAGPSPFQPPQTWSTILQPRSRGVCVWVGGVPAKWREQYAPPSVTGGPAAWGAARSRRSDVD